MNRFTATEEANKCKTLTAVSVDTCTAGYPADDSDSGYYPGRYYSHNT